MSELMIAEVQAQTLTWGQAVQFFSLRNHSKNISPATYQLYTRHLRKFIEWLRTAGNPGPGDIKPTHIRGFIECTQGSGVSSGTVDIYWRLLKTFFRFLVRDGYLQADPMLRVDRPKREKRLIKPITPEMLKAILDQVDTQTSLGARDFALIVLLYDTGLRLGEALNLLMKDVDLVSNQVRVLGKGRIERVCPFGQSVSRALRLWLQHRGTTEPTDRLFVTRFGEPLNVDIFGHHFKKLTRAAGIEGKRVSAHGLRHGFALEFLKGGGDCFVLQRLLGHADLEMTRRYVNESQADILSRARQSSPLDRMGSLPGERKRVRFA